MLSFEKIFLSMALISIYSYAEGLLTSAPVTNTAKIQYIINSTEHNSTSNTYTLLVKR